MADRHVVLGEAHLQRAVERARRVLDEVRQAVARLSFLPSLQKAPGFLSTIEIGRVFMRAPHLLVERDVAALARRRQHREADLEGGHAPARRRAAAVARGRPRSTARR